MHYATQVTQVILEPGVTVVLTQNRVKSIAHPYSIITIMMFKLANEFQKVNNRISCRLSK
jgi:hypothetical protein